MYQELRNKYFNTDLFINMEIEEIKQKIAELAKEHHALEMPDFDEIQFAEIIEASAIELLVSFCESKGYLINGFPSEKRKLFENGSQQELEKEEYFSQERFQLYLDYLSLEKEDVADLYWFLQKSFWPDSFESKEEWLEFIRGFVEWGYDFEL